MKTLLSRSTVCIALLLSLTAFCPAPSPPYPPPWLGVPQVEPEAHACTNFGERATELFKRLKGRLLAQRKCCKVDEGCRGLVVEKGRVVWSDMTNTYISVHLNVPVSDKLAALARTKSEIETFLICTPAAGELLEEEVE